LLGVSLSKVKDMERVGVLTPIKLTKSPASVVHHNLAQVKALAGEGGE
jgi:hypothetical protein